VAIRFAGDYFGIPLTEDRGADSELLKYFPSLRKVEKSGSAQEGARGFGGTKAVTPFTGFKTFEAVNEDKKTAPVFTGFKTPEYRASK